MASVFGAVFVGTAAIFMLLSALGLPTGEFVLGGSARVLPSKMRILAGILGFVQLFAIVVLLSTGNLISVILPLGVARGFCFFFAFCLTVDVLFHLCSKSGKQRFVMTPISVFAASCFWITALGA